MAKEPEQLDDVNLPEIDHRSVAILWPEDAERPEITYTASSIYEAIGFLVAAALDLATRTRFEFNHEDGDDEDDA